jgi:hypothetical protein
VDLVGSHAYQRDGVDLLRGQATSTKRTTLIRCEAFDFVRGLRLIRIDRPEPPESASPGCREWEAVITETLGLQPCPQPIHQAAGL